MPKKKAIDTQFADAETDPSDDEMIESAEESEALESTPKRARNSKLPGTVIQEAVAGKMEPQLHGVANKRPFKVTRVQKAFMDALPKCNFQVTKTCKFVGINERNFYYWLRDEQFRRFFQYKMGLYTANVQLSHFRSATTGGPGNVLAQIHILKKLVPEYAEGEQSDDGSQKMVVHSTGPTPDQMAQAIGLAAVWLAQSGLLKPVAEKRDGSIDVETEHVTPDQIPPP